MGGFGPFDRRCGDVFLGYAGIVGLKRAIVNIRLT